MSLIPIIILTRNSFQTLEKAVAAIRSRTLVPHEIIICDNASDTLLSDMLLQKLEPHVLKIFRNRSNRWILGLNDAIAYCETRFPGQFLAISDDDIVVPEPVEGLCWLGHLKNLLEANPFIGKLGLGLDLSNIQDRPDMGATFLAESKYKKRALAPGVWLAPVDTTMALYRKDLFVTKRFRFFPGHNSYVKPYFYTGRTMHPYEAVHLGWDHYADCSQAAVNAKVFCFTKYAAFIDPSFLRRSSISARLFHTVFRQPIRLFWLSRLALCTFRYIAERRVIYQNEIYARSRFGD